QCETRSSQLSFGMRRSHGARDGRKVGASSLLEKTIMTKVEVFQFQAETKQVLDLVINSLYTNKEIFLRELISNSSDALERLRFEAVTNPDLLDGDNRYEIRLESDSNARPLSISDSGIGMSRDEVIANIGTIAKSGTRELRKNIGDGSSARIAAELIGQF